MPSICEEQRRLEEEEQDLLGTGSGDSAADETELLNMDIDDEDEASLVAHNDEPKPSGVGTAKSKSQASTNATRFSANTTTPFCSALSPISAMLGRPPMQRSWCRSVCEWGRCLMGASR